MTERRAPRRFLSVVFAAAAGTAVLAAAPPQSHAHGRPLVWADLPPAVQARLEKSGFAPDTFPQKISRLGAEHAQRVRDGDLEHVVYYMLQSKHFTRLPPLEPAIIAMEGHQKAFTPPPAVRARTAALIRALNSKDRDPRLGYIRAVLDAYGGGDREGTIARAYSRAMLFLNLKERAARRFPGIAAVVLPLYGSRGFSTDTAVEAGYAVHVGLGVLRALDPALRIRRVLIVGPGMDLAPRTGMLEQGPPESYQPWAVIDALVSLGLSRLDDLEVVGADINPRVVDHLRASRAAPPSLRLASGLQESATLRLSADYREYFAGLGRAIGKASDTKPRQGRLWKTVRVDPAAAATLGAERLNVVTERLEGEPFDLVIATNVLPYFDRVELMLALASMAAMLKPGGVLLHNEGRRGLPEDAAAAGLPLEQSRQVVIATVTGAPPLADSVWLHRKTGGGA